MTGTPRRWWRTRRHPSTPPLMWFIFIRFAPPATHIFWGRPCQQSSGGNTDAGFLMCALGTFSPPPPSTRC